MFWTLVLYCTFLKFHDIKDTNYIIYAEVHLCSLWSMLHRTPAQNLPQIFMLRTRQ